MMFNWVDFKALIEAHKLPFYYVNNLRKYELHLFLDEQKVSCIIHKEQSNYASDLADFETNYKAKGNIPSMGYMSPFASKIVSGHKLFRRKHSCLATPVTIQAGQSANLDFTVPYAKCKMTAIEVMGCKEHDQASLYVLMGATVLNQFGFDVVLCNSPCKDASEYDADLVAGLTVRVTIKNNQTTEQKYNFNITLHEMVTI